MISTLVGTAEVGVARAWQECCGNELVDTQCRFRESTRPSQHTLEKRAITLMAAGGNHKSNPTFTGRALEQANCHGEEASGQSISFHAARGKLSSTDWQLRRSTIFDGLAASSFFFLVQKRLHVVTCPERNRTASTTM